MRFAIVDLDGTICDDRHRRHLIKPAGPDRYDEYHAACGDDLLMNDGCLLVTPAIIIFTARPERWRDATERWLEKRGIAVHQLLMRRDQDCSPSPVLKERFLRETQRWMDKADRCRIAVAFDDRRDVIAMYRRNCIPAVKVGYDRKAQA